MTLNCLVNSCWYHTCRPLIANLHIPPYLILYPQLGYLKDSNAAVLSVNTDISQAVILLSLRETIIPQFYLTIIPRGRVGYEMLDSQQGVSSRVGYNHLISNQREWNNCFIKIALKISMNLPHLIFFRTNRKSHTTSAIHIRILGFYTAGQLQKPRR